MALADSAFRPARVSAGVARVLLVSSHRRRWLGRFVAGARNGSSLSAGFGLLVLFRLGVLRASPSPSCASRQFLPGAEVQRRRRAGRAESPPALDSPLKFGSRRQGHGPYLVAHRLGSGLCPAATFASIRKFSFEVDLNSALEKKGWFAKCGSKIGVSMPG